MNYEVVKNWSSYKKTMKGNIMCNMKPINEGLKFHCDHCDFNATRKSSLLRHMKSTHEGVKFPCEQCDYKATHKGNLLTHIKSIHEGVKLPCKQCDYKASWKGQLLKHIKSKHESSFQKTSCKKIWIYIYNIEVCSWCIRFQRFICLWLLKKKCS